MLPNKCTFRSNHVSCRGDSAVRLNAMGTMRTSPENSSAAFVMGASAAMSVAATTITIRYAPAYTEGLRDATIIAKMQLNSTDRPAQV